MCPATAVNINKAQGLTLKAMDLNLPSPTFSHRQLILYVGLVRLGAAECVKVHASSNVRQDDRAGVYTL